MFVISIVVGLILEMLFVIMIIIFVKGVVSMLRYKVVVKNFGII